MRINDIIGKTWLASLDDSEGYVLSFKLIEQNSSSPVSPETEQEAKSVQPNSSSEVSPEKEQEPKSAVTENPTQTKKPRRDSNTPILRQLRYDLTSYFKGKHQQFRDFVKEVNTFIEDKKLGIKVIEYNESGVIEDKIEALIRKFEHETKLPCLREVFDDFKTSFL